VTDTAELHSNQVEYWNGEGGARWIATQERRAKSLEQFANRAFERAKVGDGESVIDIGCGCGETSVELAKLVGPTGKVLAADVSGPILAQATANLAPHPNARAVVADAAAYPFEPASADLIFSRFGVMFFGDPAAAFTNIRKAIKPDGRMVFVCWRTPKENPWMNGPLDTVFKFIPRPPPPSPDDPSPFAFASQDRVSGILTKAGFAPPTFEPFDTTIDVSNGGGVDGALESALEFGPLPRLLADTPADLKAEIVEALRGHFQSLSDANAFFQPAAVWIVSTKPV
jgi:SAM-dependent methyltransferase